MYLMSCFAAFIDLRSENPKNLAEGDRSDSPEATSFPSTRHKSADKSKPWNRAAYEERLSTFKVLVEH
jgi:hypothetical protein